MPAGRPARRVSTIRRVRWISLGRRFPHKMVILPRALSELVLLFYHC